MRNLLIGGVAATLGLLFCGAPAQAGEWYAVIENDATFINKGVTDLGMSAAGVGYATWIGDKAVISAELSTGAIYGGGEIDHIVKGSVELATMLDDKGKNTFVVSLEDTYDTENGVNMVSVESKFRIGL